MKRSSIIHDEQDEVSKRRKLFDKRMDQQLQLRSRQSDKISIQQMVAVQEFIKTGKLRVNPTSTRSRKFSIIQAARNVIDLFDYEVNKRKEEETIQNNRNQLIAALKEYELEARSDSKLCCEFIYSNHDQHLELDHVVNTMREMNWFFHWTNYGQIMQRLVQEYRDMRYYLDPNYPIDYIELSKQAKEEAIQRISNNISRLPHLPPTPDLLSFYNRILTKKEKKLEWNRLCILDSIYWKQNSILLAEKLPQDLVNCVGEYLTINNTIEYLCYSCQKNKYAKQCNIHCCGSCCTDLNCWRHHNLY